MRWRWRTEQQFMIVIAVGGQYAPGPIFARVMYIRME
jgi:hypothetical protein